MSAIWQRTQVLLAVALLLVPLALKGHAHTNEASSLGCVSCIAVRYAPSVAPARAPAVQTVLVVVPLPPPPELLVTTEFHATPATGRSPPVVVSAVA
jgi:hypothetical protein